MLLIHREWFWSRYFLTGKRAASTSFFLVFEELFSLIALVTRNLLRIFIFIFIFIRLVNRRIILLSFVRHYLSRETFSIYWMSDMTIFFLSVAKYEVRQLFPLSYWCCFFLRREIHILVLFLFYWCFFLPMTKHHKWRCFASGWYFFLSISENSTWYVFWLYWWIFLGFF